MSDDVMMKNMAKNMIIYHCLFLLLERAFATANGSTLTVVDPD